jgi:hypothetical protein
MQVNEPVGRLFLTQATTHSNIGPLQITVDNRRRPSIAEDANLRVSLGTLGSWSTASSPVNKVREWLESPTKLDKLDSLNKYPNYLQNDVEDVLMETLFPRKSPKRYLTPVAKVKMEKKQHHQSKQPIPAKAFTPIGGLETPIRKAFRPLEDRQRANKLELDDSPMDIVTDRFKLKQLSSKPSDIVLRNRQLHDLQTSKRRYAKTNEGYVNYVVAKSKTSPKHQQCHSPSTFMFSNQDVDDDLACFLDEETLNYVQKGASPITQNEIIASRGSSRISNRSYWYFKSREEDKTTQARQLLHTATKQKRREAILELLNYDRKQIRNQNL